MLEGFITIILVTLILLPLKIWQDKVNKEIKENDDSKKDNTFIDKKAEVQNDTKLNNLINTLENNNKKME